MASNIRRSAALDSRSWRRTNELELENEFAKENAELYGRPMQVSEHV